MSIRTLDVELTELDIVSTLDIQRAYTTYLDVIDVFPTETAIINIYNYLRSTVDPIKSEADFFVALHNGDLQLKGNTQGVDNPNITQTISVTDKIGLEDLSPQFVLNWYEKFQNAQQEVKDKVTAALGEDNIYFKPFSESIGAIKNVEFVKDLRTLPVYDVNSTINDIPLLYNSILRYTMSETAQQVSLTLSKKTNSVFRSNIINILYDPFEKTNTITDTEDAHGINLVTDYKYYKDLKAAVVELKEGIYEELDDMARVLVYVSNHVEQLKMDKLYFTMLNEGVDMDVDLLLDRVKGTRDFIRNADVLGC